MRTGSSQLRLTTGVSTSAFGSSSSFGCVEAVPAPVPLLSAYTATWLQSIAALLVLAR
jgi:hypothetical protein